METLKHERPLPRRRIQITPSAEALAKEGARIFVRSAIEAIERRGKFCVLLSGGNTPRRMYEVLATKKVPWSVTHLFWEDERMVPPDQPESNYGMTRKALIDKIAIPPDHVHRIEGELPPPEAAQRYLNELENFFGGFPIFDLVLLGLGPEGHTASLFPENEGSLSGDFLVKSFYIEKHDSWRVSVGLSVINAARSVVFLVSGAQKGAVLRSVIKEGRASRMPAAHVAPERGEVHWLIDLDAAMAMKK